MTRLVDLLGALLLALAPCWSSPLRAQSVPPAVPAGALRIGTWNLEWFGQRRDPGPRTEADVRAIGALIRQLGPSVLAVQEIADEAALTRLCDAIGESWRHVLGTSSSQRVGFLYDDTRVELLHAEELRQLPRSAEELPIFHRLPVTACFLDKASGMDFRCVVVHFKAATGAVNEKKRRLEASLLAEWLATLQRDSREDQDYLVLGDFNCSYGTAPQAALEQGAVTRWLPQQRPERTILHRPEPIDHVAVSPAFTAAANATLDAHGELAGADAATRKAWRVTYSDHFPVTFDLPAGQGDSDPAATFQHGPRAQWLHESRRPSPGAARPPGPDGPARRSTNGGDGSAGRRPRPCESGSPPR